MLTLDTVHLHNIYKYIYVKIFIPDFNPKLANFVYICYTREKKYPVDTYRYLFSRENNCIKYLLTLKGYIFYIFQHFTTKLCTLTEFILMLFQASLNDFLVQSFSKLELES